MASDHSTVARNVVSFKRLLKQYRGDLIVLVLVPLLVFVGYAFEILNTGGTSDAIMRRYFSLVSHTKLRQMSDEIRLIRIEEKDPFLGDFTDDSVREHARASYAKLLRVLERSDASIVAFDMYFKPPSQDPVGQVATEEFLQAVREVNSRGATQVILGYVPGEYQGLSSLPREQRGAVDVADEESGSDGTKFVENAVLAIAQDRKLGNQVQEVLITPPPLAVSVFIARMVQKSGEPVTLGTKPGSNDVVLYQRGRGIRRIRTVMRPCTPPAAACNLDNGFQWQRKALVPFVMPFFDSEISIPYKTAIESSSQTNDFRGKIVFIGAEVEEEKRSARGTIPTHGLYGYEVQAAIASDLLSGAWLSRLSRAAEFVVLFVIAAITLISRRFLPRADIEVDTHVIGKRSVPAGLLILFGMYALVAVIAYSTANLLLEPGYDLLIVVIMYFSVSFTKHKAQTQEWL